MLSLRQATLRAVRAASTAANAAPNVAFIGLGNMGSGMALNLHRNGASIRTHDVMRDSPGVQAILAEKIQFSETVASLLDGPLDYVISMVPASNHVRELYMGKNGIIEMLGSKSEKKPILIDCSTIDISTAKEVGAYAATKGFGMLDAPVSGGVPGAQNGTLTFMVGGEAADFQRARDEVLSKMGVNAFHCGGASLGQASKTCNNLILAASMLGVAEGFRLGSRFGIDTATLFNVVNSSTGKCWASEIYCPAPGALEGTPASRDYEPPSFMVDLMAKDLQLALNAAEAVGATAPVTQHSLQVYKKVQDAGHGKLDFGCVYKHMPGAK